MLFIEYLAKPNSNKINADPQKLNNFFNITAHRLLNSRKKPQLHFQSFIENLPGIVNPVCGQPVSYDDLKKQ